MSYIKIDGKAYDDIVVGVSEAFEVRQSQNKCVSLSENSKMILDPLGTFYRHIVTFSRRPGKEIEYDRLYEIVSQPTYEGILVEMVHGQDIISYHAFCETGRRELARIGKNGRVYWDKITVEFIPMEAQIIP